MIVTRVGIGSVAKLMATMYVMIGLIVGAIFALLAVVGAGFAQMAQGGEEAPPAFLAPLFGVGAILVFPLLYGILGLVGGAIMAAIYNLCSRLVGGLVVDLE